MSTFVRYDPIFRNLIGTESGVDPEALRKVLETNGVTFIETDMVPGPLETLYVGEDKQFHTRAELPASSRPADMQFAMKANVPQVPLPPGGATEPAAGTPLPSGDSYVRVRAPGYLDHYFMCRVWTAEDAKNELLFYASNKRWELETAGAPFRGHLVATDDRSKLMMMSAVMAAGLVVNWSTTWQFLDGSSLKLNKADVTEMSLVVQAYVNSLFGTFATIKADIQAGGVTTRDQVDARFAASLKAGVQ